MKTFTAAVLLLGLSSAEAKEGLSNDQALFLTSSPPPPSRELHYVNARSPRGAPAPPRSRASSPEHHESRTAPPPPKSRTAHSHHETRKAPAPPKSRTAHSHHKAREAPAPPHARTSPAPPKSRASAPAPPNMREAPAEHHHARVESSGHLRSKPKAEASSPAPPARTRSSDMGYPELKPKYKVTRTQDNQYWYAGNNDYSNVVSCGACCFGTPVPVADSVFAEAGNPYKDLVEANGFYGKVIDVGGVPVIGSNAVSDAALQEQALTLVKLVVKNPSLLDDLKADTILAAMIGKDERITDIPAYADLDSIWPLSDGQTWDDRAGGGGIGATMRTRTVSCEENDTLCLTSSQYAHEMICIHELAHTVGGNSVDHSRMIPFSDGVRDFKQVLDDTYQTQVVENGLYSNSIHSSDSYATTNEAEYWATGVQAYYNVGRNGVNTRDELRNYDPLFYDMVHQVLDPDVSHTCPDCSGNCDCDATRDLCERAGVSTSRGVDSVESVGSCEGEVEDAHASCASWASQGECTNNPAYMLSYCAASCANTGGSGSSSGGGTDSSGSSSGGDQDTNCSSWADSGECLNNPGWMLPNCPDSCGYLDTSQYCGEWASGGECTSNPGYMLENCPVSCANAGAGIWVDRDENCSSWASAGYCTSNPGYMLESCPISCMSLDEDTNCVYWASTGECESNPGYMLDECPVSCAVEQT